MKAQRSNYRRARHSGFTLIEVVVALSILALALGVLYESFGWSLRRTAILEKREAAWLTAQSLLAEIRGRYLLRAGTQQGQAPGGLKWESHIGMREAALDEQSPIKAFEVTIEVSWGSRPAQRIQLQSVETSRIAS